MKIKSLTQLLFFTAVGVLFLTADVDESLQFNFATVLIQDAQAVVGRPLTPASVGGVRRRTRRRTAVVTAAAVSTPIVAPAVISTPVVTTTPVVVNPAPVVVNAPAPASTLATGTIVSALPSGCSTIVVSGATYHSCGSVYFKPAFQSDNVVYVVVDKP